MATNPSLSRFIQRNVYAMKRQYGTMVDLYRILSSQTDHLTGTKTVVKEVHRIRHAPVLPYRMKRDLVQTISIISADKKFVYGGAYDASRREVIIDARDLPRGVEIRPEDYLVIDGQRWTITEIEKFECDAGWALTTKHLPNVPPYEIHDLLVTQDLALAQFAVSYSADEIPGALLQALGIADSHAVIKLVGGLPVNSSPLHLQQTVVSQVS
jgi:hypothetical protein